MSNQILVGATQKALNLLEDSKITLSRSFWKACEAIVTMKSSIVS